MQAWLGEHSCYYLRRGPRTATKPPLLLLHGGPGLDHTSLRPWLDGLGSDRELIYVDALGCGRSIPGAGGLAEHDLQHTAAQLEALRLHLKVERWLVFGHGFGAFEAQAYGLRHPDACAGLILCNGAAAFDYPHELVRWSQEECQPAQLAAVIQMLTQPSADDEGLRTLWRTLLPLFFYRYDLKVGEGLLAGCRFSAAGFNYGLFEMGAHVDLSTELGRLQPPALLLGGRHDWLVPPARGALRLARCLPHAAMVLFEESGHFPFIEEPVAFSIVVKRWLKQYGGSPRL